MSEILVDKSSGIELHPISSPNVPTEAIVKADPPSVPFTRHLVAKDPQELCAAQGKMMAWANAKIDELQADLAEMQTELKIAHDSKWRTGPWKKRIALCQNRIVYYQKMREIFGAGYFLVPVMPMETFAIRVNKDSRLSRVESTNAFFAADAVKVNTLPAGEGDMVSDRAEVRSYEKSAPYKDNPGRTETKWYPVGTQDIEYPMDVAKPVVMTRAAEAIAARLFDEIGVVRDRATMTRGRGDPFVIGRIRDPRANKPGACFFIGWCIDLENL